MTAPKVPLDTPLMRYSPTEAVTIRQAFEGVQIFGGIGSGKTSGSGRTLAHGFLRLGFGGLVLCVKPDEADTWRQYARETGREDSFLFVDGSEGQGFNFLNYELRAYAHEGNQINNAVEVFMHIMKNVGSGGSPKKDDGSPFWDNSVRDLLRACLNALTISYGNASLENVFRMALTAHQNEEQLQDPQWQQTSYCYQSLMHVEQRASNADARALRIYFRHVWGGMAPKLRSDIIATLSSLCGSFMFGRLREMFCTNTSFLPEMTHNGAVIVLDMPVKSWQSDGIIAQQIIKYAWQRATERRGSRGRNVFLWVDEAQSMLSDYDSEFQSTARSSRAATVYMTQNINMYHRAIGGADAHYVVHGLLGNLKTKIFHANDDIDTNKYAVDLIGTTIHRRRNANQSISTNYSEGTNHSHSTGKNWGESTGINESESQGHNHSKSRNYSRSSQTGMNSTSNPQGGHSSGFSRSSGSTSGHSTSTGTSHTTTIGSNQSFNAGGNENYSEGMNTTRSAGQNAGAGWSEQKDTLIEPHFFRTGLATGGPRYDLIVEGIIVQSGLDAPQYRLARFKQ